MTRNLTLSLNMKWYWLIKITAVLKDRDFIKHLGYDSCYR